MSNMCKKLELTFALSNGGKLKITPEAFQRISEFIQIEPQHSEAGGVLLGRLIKDSKNIVIDRVSIPMVADKRTRFSFLRNAKIHQRIIDKAWKESSGTCNYLGEWHSHPESYPTPSGVDLKNWRNRLIQDTYFSRYLYFLILGIKEFYIWEGDRRTSKFKKLKNT